MKDYIKIYGDFLDSYLKGGQSGREIGEAAAQMAGCYEPLNRRVVDAKILETEKIIAYKAKKDDIMSQSDPLTGKQIAVNRAEVMVDATDEYADWQRSIMTTLDAKADVASCELQLEALRVLQYGVGQDQKYISAQ